MSQIQLTAYFCMAYKLRLVFIFSELKKIKRIIFHGTGKLHGIQISVSLSNMCLNHSLAHSFLCCLHCLNAMVAKLSFQLALKARNVYYLAFY